MDAVEPLAKEPRMTRENRSNQLLIIKAGESLWLILTLKKLNWFLGAKENVLEKVVGRNKSHHKKRN